MSLYDHIYRRFVYPRRIRSFAPDLLSRIERTRNLLDAPDLNETVSRKLNSLVTHAATTCEFWKERFSAAAIDAKCVTCVEDLRLLPLLEKTEIRESLPALTTQAIRPELLKEDFTGGSTSSPTKFYRNQECIADRVANEWIYFGWYGRKPWDRWGHIWGARQDIGVTSTIKAKLRGRLLDRVITLPGNQLSPPMIEAYLHEMRQFRPQFLHAYSQAVFFVAKYLISEKRDVPKMTAVTVTAEPISGPQRRTISQAFDCPTYSIYGTRECGMIAAEAPDSPGMHINPLNALVEFIGTDGKPADPGTPGQIVVTDLLNYATPLIRYRIGDVGVALTSETPGDRGMPRMELSAGRETDFLVTRDQRFIAGAGLTLISETGVSQLQYEQTIQGQVNVKYVSERSFHGGTLDALRQQIAAVVGSDMKIEFTKVDSIPLLPSGKLQYVRSDVASALLQVQAQKVTN